jgi:hydroxyacyl-ACP dehydratase HTD2-like protein with hotdog domain
MVAKVRHAEVSVDTRLPDMTVSVSRLALLLFGGQTMRLDFAAPHWSQRLAKAAGYPDLVLQGPFTLAKTLEIINSWTGDPGAIIEHEIRLVRAITVPDDEIGAVLNLSGTVTEKDDHNGVVVQVVATSPEQQVLAKLRARVRLA